jgi:DNA modification methylase
MIELIHGDCLTEMKELTENTVDSVVTDPPAGISFMGKEWDSHKGGRDEWIRWLSEVMTEAKRVLKPGGHAFVWALPRTSHWTGMALENAGFEVRDCVHHIFGSGTTGCACRNLGYSFIGIEKEKEYYEIAEKRIYSGPAARSIIYIYAQGQEIC